MGSIRSTIDALSSDPIILGLRQENVLALNLKGRSYSDQDAITLAGALRENSSLSSLNLARNELTDTGALAIADVLTTRITRMSIDLRGNRSITAAAAIGLATKTSLRSLAISNHDSTLLWEKNLASAFIANTRLRSLALEVNVFDDQGAESLASIIASGGSLASLDMYRCPLTGDAGATSFATALATNTALERLRWRYSSLRHPHIATLALALTSNATLKTLDLQGNLKADHVAEIATALSVNTTLTSVDLSKNAIADAGATALANALRNNSTLKSLRLKNNDITDVGGSALANALTVNSALILLCLKTNRITDVGGSALASALTANTTLTSLGLNLNRIGDTGGESLANTLRINSSLTRLNLKDNELTQATIFAYATTLIFNSTLSSLGLSARGPTDTAIKALLDTVKSKSNLTSLDLGYVAQADNAADLIRRNLHKREALDSLQNLCTQALVRTVFNQSPIWEKNPVYLKACEILKHPCLDTEFGEQSVHLSWHIFVKAVNSAKIPLAKRTIQGYQLKAIPEASSAVSYLTSTFRRHDY